MGTTDLRFDRTVKRNQWLFGLCTATAVLCLGLWLNTLNESAMALIVLGAVIGLLNSYTFLQDGLAAKSEIQAIALRTENQPNGGIN